MREDQTIIRHYADLAIDEDGKFFQLYRAPGRCKVTAAYVAAEAAVAAADTHYNTLRLRKSGAVEVASLANGPVAGGVAIPVASGAPTAMTLATGAGIFLDAGEVLYLQLVKTGNGLAIPGFSLQVEIQDLRAP